jgi:hypothetical protein
MSFTGMLTLIAALHGQPTLAPNLAATINMRELFPGVRADLAAKTVEFDGLITPMLVKDERAPLFFLESLACSPNTREHETFIVTNARPSHIHAALLAIGLKPGAPGSWTLTNGTLVPTPPSGDRLAVRILYADKEGRQVEADPLDWIVNARDKARFADSEAKLAAARAEAAPGWVFAGSRIVKRKQADGEEREVYDADGSGTIVGLTSFGSEVISWSRLISPDASAEEPEWIADFSRTPAAETKVRVRLRLAE